jgi:caa(3)-type oxidase subunit IV
MAAVTATDVKGSSDHSAHDDHPSDLIYWKVFGALLVLTALEVSTYWWPEEWHKVTAVLLIIMMAIKFVTVALYFMHLKNDALILKRVFFAGLVLAFGVYFAALGALTFFKDSGTGSDGRHGFNDPPREKPLPPPATDPPPIIRDTGHHG